MVMVMVMVMVMKLNNANDIAYDRAVITSK